MQRNKIDFWRVYFAFLVVSVHSSSLLAENETFSMFQGGYIAVEFFFILSGFFMMQSVSRAPKCSVESVGTETISFLWRKIKQLFPYFITGFIISFAISHIVWKTTWYSLIKDLAYSVYEILFLGMLNVHSLFNSVAWYISAMLFAYLILYPIARLIPDFYGKVISFVLFSFYLCWVTKRTGFISLGNMTHYGAMLGGTIRAIAMMSLGAFLFAVSVPLTKIRFTSLSKKCFKVVEIAGYLTVGIAAYFRWNSTLDYVLLVILATSMLITLRNLSCKTILFNNKQLKFMSNFSYVLFVTHGRISRLVKYLLPDCSYVERLLPYYILCVLVALVCMMIVPGIGRFISSKKKYLVEEN